MLTRRFETGAGRARHFFTTLRNVALLLIGPTAALQHRNFESSASVEHAVIIAVAIYAEVTLESLADFVDTVRFWRLWRGREAPRVYSRRLRGVRVPDCVAPLRVSDTSVQVARSAHCLRVALFAVLVAAVLCVPVVVLDAKGIHSTAEGTVVTVALFFLVTIGASANFIAGLVFLLERLAIEGRLTIHGAHILVVISLLYFSWLGLQSVNAACRIWVVTSSDPALRALANVYLFPVTTDSIVSANEHRAGLIDAGTIYVNLRAGYGTATLTVDTAPVTEEVSLGEILKLS